MTEFFAELLVLLVALGEEVGSRWRRQFGSFGGFGQFRVVAGVAVGALHLEGGGLVAVFDADGIVGAAEGALGVVALLLERAQFAVEAAEEADHSLIGFEIWFDVGGGRGFLKEDLRKAGGGGLEADFGKFGGVVAAEVINEVVLIQTVLEDEVLFEEPIFVTTCGPVRYVALQDGEAEVVEGGDDVLVGNAVAEHAIDQVAGVLRQAGDAAAAASFVGGHGRDDG